MIRYGDLFPEGKQLFPVIHAESHDQVLRNTKIAFGEGADGVFLIDHIHKKPLYLKEFYFTARDAYPDFQIGLNFLTLPAAQAYAFAPDDTFAIWSDSARSSLSIDGMNKLNQAWSRHHRGVERPLYFGGVAFKYQPDESADPKASALQARMFVDVITTSGSRTGTPPRVEKIRAMRDAIDDHAMVIASGTSPENINLFLPYVNGVLVATGVSDSTTELSAKKVAEMRKRMQNR